MLLALLKVIAAIIGVYMVAKLLIWVYGNQQLSGHHIGHDVDGESTDDTGDTNDGWDGDGSDSGGGDGGSGDGGGGD